MPRRAPLALRPAFPRRGWLLPALRLLPLSFVASMVAYPSGSAIARQPPGQTQRQIEIVLPLRDGPFLLAELRTRSAGGAEMQVDAERLVDALKPLLKPDAIQEIEHAVGGRSFVPLDALAGAGVTLHFDPSANALQLEVEDGKRTPRPISVVGVPNDANRTFVEPSPLSAFVNVRSNIDYIEQAPDGVETGFVTPAGTVDGAVRIFGPVIEGESSFNGSAWYRQGTRAVFDLPEDVIRLQAGDMFLERTGFQNAEDIAGLSISRLYNELAPGRNVRPTGRRSLRIERPSDVSIYVNGRPMRRLRLQPGTYDVQDFTFFSGDNSIQIVVEDDTGHREVLDYSLFFSRSLLEPGLDEFALFGGIEAPASDNEPDYRRSKPVASGFYRRGLTETLTAGINAQGDSSTRMAGVSGILATPIGSFAGEAAGSMHDGEGLGVAGALQWELLNFELGPPGQNSLRTTVEARSGKFATISSDELNVVNNPFVVDTAISYSRELGPSTSGTLSTRYGIARGDSGDSYGADLTLSQQFGTDWLLSVTVGYNQSGTSASTESSFLGNGVSAFVSLSYAIDVLSRARATYDTRDNRSQLTYSRYGGQFNDSYSVDAQLERTDDDASLNGNVTYYGNRGEIGLAHTADITNLDGETLQNRTSLRPSFSLAYAGGRVALGRPILNSFALVGTAANLDDHVVSIGPSGDEEARSGWLMPASVWDLSPYSPRRLTYDVEDLPIGYDLGSGVFDINPPYKSGYDLAVGSAFNVTAVGTLVDKRGEAVALSVGEAEAVSGTGKRTVGVFTNRSGRFVAQGLGPGRWRLRMDTTPPIEFELTIPGDAVGLFRAGDLAPVGGSVESSGGNSR
jgi:P pilus assembly protein, porin PapC